MILRFERQIHEMINHIENDNTENDKSANLFLVVICNIEAQYSSINDSDNYVNSARFRCFEFM